MEKLKNLLRHSQTVRHYSATAADAANTVFAPALRNSLAQEIIVEPVVITFLLDEVKKLMFVNLESEDYAHNEASESY